MHHSEQGSIVSIISTEATHNDINRLIKVENLSIFVHNGHGTDTLLGKHVNNVEYRSLQSSGCNGKERFMISRATLRVDIGTDPALLNSSCKVLGNITALSISMLQKVCLTFMAMNFSTRYCVSTLMTTSPLV